MGLGESKRALQERALVFDGSDFWRFRRDAGSRRREAPGGSNRHSGRSPCSAASANETFTAYIDPDRYSRRSCLTCYRQ